MKKIVFQLISKYSISSKYADDLYQIGLKNIMDNLEYYHDKTYTCESVLKELFIRGIESHIEKRKTQLLN